MNTWMSKNGRNAYYIAEIGLNHNGDFDTAKKMIELAADAGADAVKFQTFVPEMMNSVYTSSLIKDGTEAYRDNTQIEFFRKFIFSKNDYFNLKKISETHQVAFFSSPFDIESVDLLEDIGVPFYKLASSELTNLPLVKKIAATKKSVLVSTGMSRENEIRECIEIFRSTGNSRIAILHCVSLYPVSGANVNLKRIKVLNDIFSVETGFSDHSRGSSAASCAAMFGARIFEKHFTVDRDFECPDKEVSLSPDDFRKFILDVEESIDMIGSGSVEFGADEAVVARAARRSAFAAADIPSGKVLEEGDIVFLRPGTGIRPSEALGLIGKRVAQTISKDSLIRSEYFF